MHQNLTHNEFVYKVGLNEDTLQFNPSGECLPGGLYFTDITNCFKWRDYGDMVAIISLFQDSQIYVEPCGTKMKANKFNIDQIISKEEFFSSLPDKFLIENICKDYTLLQYVKEQTAEICLAAVKRYGYVLQYVKELLLVLQEWDYLSWLRLRLQ